MSSKPEKTEAEEELLGRSLAALAMEASEVAVRVRPGGRDLAVVG